MRKQKPTIDEQLMQAFYNFNLTKSNHSWAENQSFDADIACREAQREYDQTFYRYVEFGTREHLQQHEIARIKLENAYKKSLEAKSQVKIAFCKFRKAEKLYHKLQKKSGKTTPQFGGN